MITDFTLFDVAIINASTKERIDQGEMSARRAKEFVEKMETRNIPVIVTSKTGDALDFNDYLFNSKLVSSIVPSRNN